MQLDNYLCANLTGIGIEGNWWTYEYMFLEIDALQCVGDSSCLSQNELYTIYKEYDITTMFIEGYYKQDNITNPIGYRFSEPNRTPLNIYKYSERNSFIISNVVTLANGTNQYFFTTYSDIHIARGYSNYGWICMNYFLMSNKVIVHKQEKIFVPVWTAKRNMEYAIDIPRRLSDSEKEKLMSPEFFTLFTLAQLGGLYVMLILIFGLFVGCFTKKAFNQDIINSDYKYNLIYTKNQLKKESMYQGGQNRADAREMDRSMYESDPLIQAQMQSSFNKNQSNRQSSINGNGRNNEMYDGGDNLDNFNSNDHSQDMMYNTGDLMYSLF